MRLRTTSLLGGRTAADDRAVHVLPVTVPLDRTGELACDRSDGDLW